MHNKHLRERKSLIRDLVKETGLSKYYLCKLAMEKVRLYPYIRSKNGEVQWGSIIDPRGRVHVISEKLRPRLVRWMLYCSGERNPNMVF
jgi:hypothetical protein